MGRAAQTAISLACVGFTVCGFYNVMGDNTEVEHAAHATACGTEGPACRAQKTAMERTPFAQTFEFATAKRTVGVRCARAFVLVGDYACAVR